jgi:hypothetical protein
MAISWCSPQQVAWLAQARVLYGQGAPVQRMDCLLDQSYCRLAVEHENDAVRSMALVGLFPAEQFLHLDHFDVAPGEDRNRALGRMLAFLSTTDLALDSLNRWDFLTVEAPDACLDEYTGHGGRRLDGLNCRPSPALQLVVFPYRGQKSLTANRVREVVRVIQERIHFQVYEPDGVELEEFCPLRARTISGDRRTADPMS